MLLTKKSSDVHPVHRTGSARFVQSLSRGLSNALPTMDRRAFLRRSGLGVGVGLAATQLTLVKKATAAAPDWRRASGRLVLADLASGDAPKLAGGRGTLEFARGGAVLRLDGGTLDDMTLRSARLDWPRDAGPTAPGWPWS